MTTTLPPGLGNDHRSSAGGPADLVGQGTPPPPTQPPDSQDDLQRIIRSSAISVFGTMLSYQVALDPLAEAEFSGQPHVAGAVGLTGAYTGMIYLFCTATFARRVTSDLLGLGEADIDGEEIVNDAIGELTNMLAGRVKSELAATRKDCMLTIPSVVRGVDFNVAPVKRAARCLVALRCNGGPVVVEALIKSAGPVEGHPWNGGQRAQK
jgi:chemotaxis protein CheX